MKKLAPKKVAEVSELWPVIEANLDDVLEIFVDRHHFFSKEAAWEYFGSYADLLAWHPFEVIEFQLKRYGITIC